MGECIEMHKSQYSSFLLCQLSKKLRGEFENTTLASKIVFLQRSSRPWNDPFISCMCQVYSGMLQSVVEKCLKNKIPSLKGGKKTTTDFAFNGKWHCCGIWDRRKSMTVPPVCAVPLWRGHMIMLMLMLTTTYPASMTAWWVFFLEFNFSVSITYLLGHRSHDLVHNTLMAGVCRPICLSLSIKWACPTICIITNKWRCVMLIVNSDCGLCTVRASDCGPIRFQLRAGFCIDWEASQLLTMHYNTHTHTHKLTHILKLDTFSTRQLSISKYFFKFFLMQMCLYFHLRWKSCLRS